MGLKTLQMDRAYIVDKDDDIYLMYQRYLQLVKDINPNARVDSEIAASNLVVAKMLQKVINLAKE
tara:strand:- start:6243 stop:6437 length:195 start_codon:yes stop_codon:yes gene_type:complete